MLAGLKTQALCAPYKYYSFQHIDDWFMEQLDSKYTLAELSTGEQYCRILVKHYPLSVKANALKVKPKTEADKFKNWQILQQSFKTLGVKKDLNIPELLDERKASNWLFARWFIQLIEINREGWQPSKSNSSPSKTSFLKSFPVTSQTSRLFSATSMLFRSTAVSLPFTPRSSRNQRDGVCNCCYCRHKEKQEESPEEQTKQMPVRPTADWRPRRWLVASAEEKLGLWLLVDKTNN